MSASGVVLLVASQAATSSVASSPAAHQAFLAEVQQVLARAWVAGDRATIERLIAPDWTTTGPDGTVRTRAQVLAEVFDTHVHRIQQITIDGVEVRLFGEAAVVSGRTHALGEFAGQRYEVWIRFTDVFVRRSGQWQAVASHASVFTNQR
ncbi:MAG TPA: nuclear transport factor 2 family protein [Aestuariivirgaceae bacterium]